MTDIKRIAELAVQFRQKIESTDKDMLPIAMQHFPFGACGETATQLAAFLEQHGCGRFSYVEGWREGKSHGWLQQDTLIVDITADQFPDNDEKVIVRENSRWHKSFTIKSR